MGYHYRKLDFLFRKDGERAKNTLLQRNAAIHGPFYNEYIPQTIPKETEENEISDLQPSYELEHIEEKSDSGDSVISMMPCNRYRQNTKKRPLPNKHVLVEEAKLKENVLLTCFNNYQGIFNRSLRINMRKTAYQNTRHLMKMT